MSETLLYLETAGAVVHHTTDLRYTENTPFRVRDVGKIVFAEERPGMMLAKAVEIARVKDYLIAGQSVDAVCKGRYLRRLAGIVSAKYLFAHASYSVRCVDQSGTVRIFPYKLEYATHIVLYGVAFFVRQFDPLSSGYLNCVDKVFRLAAHFLIYYGAVVHLVLGESCPAVREVVHNKGCAAYLFRVYDDRHTEYVSQFDCRQVASARYSVDRIELNACALDCSREQFDVDLIFTNSLFHRTLIIFCVCNDIRHFGCALQYSTT